MITIIFSEQINNTKKSSLFREDFQLDFRTPVNNRKGIKTEIEQSPKRVQYRLHTKAVIGLHPVRVNSFNEHSAADVFQYFFCFL